MIPPQTLQVVWGVAAALLYAVAVTACGAMSLYAILGRYLTNTARGSVGSFGFVWLALVMGQGVMGVVWLALSLGGIFYAWPVWIFCTLGFLLACVTAITYRHSLTARLRLASTTFASLLRARSWYFWLANSLIVLIVTSGLMALLPTGIDDALRWYLVLPNVLAIKHRLELLPYLAPYYGLHPLQVEMHWAALFAIANETAVTVWDCLCAISFLAGIGFLARALTSSRRVAVIAVLMVLTTPGFYYMIGGGKPDNAAAQYGVAAFLWLGLWSNLGRRSLIIAGLCIGWMLASRYTNLFFLPALTLYFLTMLLREWRSAPPKQRAMITKYALTSAAVLGIASGIGIAPMLIKNWLLLGCPLAPVLGCQGTVWTGSQIQWTKESTWIYNRRGISPLDLASYPFIWTFGSPQNMLGNISPLFLGFCPLLLLYYRASLVRLGLLAGLAGVVSITAWWLLVNKLFPYTRWVLLPLALIAICLATSVVAVELDPRPARVARGLIKAAMVSLVLFLLFQNRAVIYAVRYAIGIDGRASSYQSKAGYDVANWLNTHMELGQRAALAGWNGYPYFVKPEHLINSESVAERNWLWQLCRCPTPVIGTEDFWKFYASRNFTYVVLEKGFVSRAMSAMPDRIAVQIAFSGKVDAVLRLVPH